MSVLLDGVKDTHAREALKTALRRIRVLEQLVAEIQSLNVVTFIPTGTGLVEYSALPATTGFEVGTFITVKTSTRWTLYTLAKITNPGAVDWMPVTQKVF